MTPSSHPSESDRPLAHCTAHVRHVALCVYCRCADLNWRRATARAPAGPTDKEKP